MNIHEARRWVDDNYTTEQLLAECQPTIMDSFIGDWGSDDFLGKPLAEVLEVLNEVLTKYPNARLKLERWGGDDYEIVHPVVAGVEEAWVAHERLAKAKQSEVRNEMRAEANRIQKERKLRLTEEKERILYEKLKEKFE